MEDLEHRRTLIDARLEEVLAEMTPPALSRSLEHVTFAGGKRVRPIVTMLSCEALGGDPEDALDFAVGIELVHTASLVVDDIIDESEVRRGAESAWKKFGTGGAIIASDALLGEAFDLFASKTAAMSIVTTAMLELGQGEAIELVDQPVNEAEYRELARRKTGALFRAAAELGAVAAGISENDIRSVGEYAERVGIAFQIRDDVLDATAEADVLGKPTGRDAQMDRPSVIEVTELSPSEAIDRAQDEVEVAIAMLEKMNAVDQKAIRSLSDIAAFVVDRDR